MQLQKPYLQVLYNGRDITADLAKSLTSFTYTDNLDEADTIDIEVADPTAKWQNTWYPDKGAKLYCEMGIEGEEILDCGNFEIDEIELNGPPDSATIRAIAAGFKEGQKRTKKSHVHESKTLAEIVKTVADGLGLKVVGKISDIRIARKMQRQERDLRFLSRLAKEYGYNFNVRDDQAIFIALSDLEGSKAVTVIQKTDLLNYSIKDKSTNTYSSASVSFLNPETSETVTFRTKEDDQDINTDDVLQLNLTAQSKAEAMMMTKAALSAANKLQQSGSISLPGSPLLVSGNVIRLEGLGILSGDYLIKQAAHTLAMDAGWTADLEIYKVGYKEEKPAANTGGKKSGGGQSDDSDDEDEDLDFFGDLNN